MDKQPDRERTERELKASVAALAAGLLQVIAGDASVHEVPRRIEEAAHAMLEHVGAGGPLLNIIAQALDVEGSVLIARGFRSLISSEDQDRETIEGLHEDAIEAIQAGAVLEVAAVLEGNRIK